MSEDIQLTEAQEEFLDSVAFNQFSAFIGGRQVGHTTALAGAIEEASSKYDVLIVAPKMDQAKNLRDKVDGEETKGSIEHVSQEGVISELYDSNLGYVFIDMVDYIPYEKFIDIYNYCNTHGLNLAVAGTPRTDNSNNIYRILNDDLWTVVHSRLDEVDHGLDAKEAKEFFDALNYAVEVEGKIIRDPSEDADFSDKDE